MIKWIKNAWKAITNPKQALSMQVINLAFASLKKFIEKVPYSPIKMFALTLTSRIKDISYFFVDNDPDNKKQIKEYLHKHKYEIIRETVTLKRAIIAEELNDKELVSILNRHSKELEEYLLKRE